MSLKTQELLNVKKDLDKKFLKFYTAQYMTDGKLRNYFFVSRHDERDLVMNNPDKVKPTAVECFTYIVEDGIPYAIMVKEFRSAMGRYVMSFPAGLIENNESFETAITREVNEEVGGEVKSFKLIQNYPLAACAGMTDEANMFAIVELSKEGTQHLEETEDIEVHKIPLTVLQKKVKNNELELTLSGYLGVLSILNIFKLTL